MTIDDLPEWAFADCGAVDELLLLLLLKGLSERKAILLSEVDRSNFLSFLSGTKH